MIEATHTNESTESTGPDAPDDSAETQESWLDEPVVSEALAFVERNLEERPYLTLAAAAGAGVVLGGGIPNWAIRAAWKNGGAKWLTGALVPVVIGAVERAMRDEESEG